MGRRHAVLVTRGGELFAWGRGQGGVLGLGHTQDAASPQRVHTLWGHAIRHVAAGGTSLTQIPAHVQTPEGPVGLINDGFTQPALPLICHVMACFIKQGHLQEHGVWRCIVIKASHLLA